MVLPDDIEAGTMKCLTEYSRASYKELMCQITRHQPGIAFCVLRQIGILALIGLFLSMDYNGNGGTICCNQVMHA